MERKIDLLCSAIHKAKCVELTYNGHHRVVEIHAVGKHANTENTLLRCYQTEGGSNSGINKGWKLMKVSEIKNATISNRDSKAPREEYNPDDSHMTGGIICRF